MKIDYQNFKKRFDEDGYFILKSFVKKNFINQIINEIDNSKDTIKYFDSSNQLRRIEKLYDKGDYLIDLNKKISILFCNLENNGFC